MNELTLIEEIRKGNRQAMQQLYGMTVRYLVGVAQRYISDQEDIKDVLQESYIQIFGNIGGFTADDPKKLKAWMSRIVVNKCIDHLRKQQLWQTDNELPDIPDEDEVDVSTVQAALLHRLIRQLPTGYRTILNLYVFEQKSHKEIAELLGIKEKTSSSQYHRAKELLRKLILQHKDDFR